MNRLVKVLLLELWFIVVFPVLGWFLILWLGPLGMFLYLILFVIWCWELFAFVHYRFCRQEEFLHVLQTAAATQAPVEAVLRAYVEDRPREDVLRGILLSFVFPGYYWFHWSNSFDFRLKWLLAALEYGVPLDDALGAVPGVVSRQTALAVTVGQFSGRLTQALNRLSERRTAPQWLELVPRLVYPLIILCALLSNVVILTTLILPRYEKIFADFRLKMPAATLDLVSAGRWLVHSSWTWPVLLFSFLLLVNVVVFSSHAKWYCPVVSWVYRLHARGQFLQTLGLMLETAKPLPEILRHVLASGLLPRAVGSRVKRLAVDLNQGHPLAESLTRRGLTTASMQGLIAAAEKAKNLPWGLQELGDALNRRSALLSYRMTSVLFPLAIFACACLVAWVAYSMFLPLITLIERSHG